MAHLRVQQTMTIRQDTKHSVCRWHGCSPYYQPGREKLHQSEENHVVYGRIPRRGTRRSLIRHIINFFFPHFSSTVLKAISCGLRGFKLRFYLKEINLTQAVQGKHKRYKLPKLHRVGFFGALVKTWSKSKSVLGAAFEDTKTQA